MIARARIIVKGTVQEAGYREEVAETAFDLYLRGQVQNLDDGTVEIICEGEKAAIRGLVRRINIRRYPVEVESVRARYSEPTGEFRKFSIVKDTRLDSDFSSKMETGFRFIKHMHRDLKGTINGVGSGVHSVGSEVRRAGSDVRRVGSEVRRAGSEVRRVGSEVRRVGSDVRGVGSDVRSMNRNMGTRFDRLDRKYDRFGRSLAGVDRSLKSLGRSSKDASRSTREMAADLRVLRRAAQKTIG